MVLLCQILSTLTIVAVAVVPLKRVSVVELPWKWWLFKAVHFLKLYFIYIEFCFAVALDTDFALDPLNIP